MIAVEIEKVDDLCQSLDRQVENSAYTTCFISLISILDPKINARTMYDALPVASGEYFDFLNMLSAMMNLGYEASQMSMPVSQIDDRLLPCVFFVDTTSPVYIVLGFVDEKRSTVKVFNCGERQVEEVRVSDVGTGKVVFFKKVDPVASNDNRKDNNESLFIATSFRKIVKGFARQFSAIIAISMLLNIFTLAMPMFVMVVYDKVIGVGQESALYFMTVGVGIAFFAEIVLRVMRAVNICWIGSRIDNVANNSVFRKIIYMETSFTENASISAQMAKIKFLESIRMFFSSSLFVTAIEVPFVAVLLVAIAFIAGPLFFVPLVAVVLNILLIVLLSGRVGEKVRVASKQEAYKQELFLETFAKAPLLRSNNMSEVWMQKLRDVSAKSALTNFQSVFTVSMLEVVASAITSITVIATVVVGTHLIWDDKMTVGALVATMIIVWRVLSPIQALGLALPKLKQMKDSIEQFNRLMKIQTESDTALSMSNLDFLEGRVQLLNVGIKYGSNAPPVFVGLNVDVLPGEIVAIYGDNGTGKTTILKLINRLCNPQIGSVRIDDIDIRQLNPLDLRHYVDYVPQTPNVFEGTVAENIRLANPLASDEDVRGALQKIDAWDDVCALEEGLDTKIGGRYMALTSSLMYQISLARSLLQDSKVLLIDELPFSILNSKSGIAYFEFIKSQRGKRTIFFITHREDHVQLADKVIYLGRDERPVVREKEV